MALYQTDSALFVIVRWRMIGSFLRAAVAMIGLGAEISIVATFSSASSTPNDLLAFCHGHLRPYLGSAS
jgi:hypothetical protein